MLTGCPGQATAKALAPVTTYELSKEDLAPVLEARPEVSIEWRRALAVRQAAGKLLASTTACHHAGSQPGSLRHTPSPLRPRHRRVIASPHKPEPKLAARLNCERSVGIVRSCGGPRSGGDNHQEEARPATPHPSSKPTAL